jgi:hypothetical protein
MLKNVRDVCYHRFAICQETNVRILNIFCIIQYSTDILGFIFLAFTNIQSLNSALYLLRSGLMNPYI